MTALHHVRWMVVRDLPAVVAIADASFAAPWSDGDFRAALRRRNCIGMVVERGDDVLAFMVYELYPDAIKLLNFAVAPAHRRQRVGSSLLAKLKYKLCSHRRAALAAAVGDENLAAHLFLRAGGLRVSAIDRAAAAYVFEWRPTAADRERYGFAEPDLSPLS